MKRYILWPVLVDWRQGQTRCIAFCGIPIWAKIGWKTWNLLFGWQHAT